MRGMLIGVAALLLVTLFAAPQTTEASNLVTSQAGNVTVEFFYSDAAYINDMSVVSPVNRFLFDTDQSRLGTRVDLGVFAAGTPFEFELIATTSSGTYTWSSDATKNADGKDHMHVTELRDGDATLDDREYKLEWEDMYDLGDGDFNDAVAILRIGADSDGDGLFDDWERFGRDGDNDGAVDVDLPAMGANPSRRDLFLEIDCVVSDGNNNGVLTDAVDHTHCPPQAAVQMVVQSFANAPVTNVDGTTGIQLHVDIGNLYGQPAMPAAGFAINVPRVLAPANSVTGNYGNFGGGGNQIPEAGNTIIDWDGAVGRAGTNFYTLKAANFDTRRSAVFRYAIFGHQTNMRQASNDCTSGVSESIPGNDFLVTLGGRADLDGNGTTDIPCWGAGNANTIDDDGDGNIDEDPVDGIDNDGDCTADTYGDGIVCNLWDVGVDEDGGFSVGTVAEQAGTLQHEFGHTLGLRHGGEDNVNNKPNYLSLMNYSFQDCSVPAAPAGGLPGACDYSRVDLPDLVETLPPGLDECVGIDGNLGLGGVDWNADGALEGATCQAPNNANVSADINGDDLCIHRGRNNTIQTARGGDDVLIAGPPPRIVTGPNFVCDSTASGDDIQVMTVGSREKDCTLAPQALACTDTGFEDWNHLFYPFQTLAEYVNGVALPFEDEPTPQLIYEARQQLAILAPKITVDKTGPTSLSATSVRYSIALANTGPGPALNVVLTDTLPDGSKVVFNLGLVSPTSFLERTVTFNVPAGLVPGSILTNVAEAEYEDLLGNSKLASDSLQTTVLAIDVKPGSWPNSINLRAKGSVPVAILSTGTFDATQVDPSSVVFAGAVVTRWDAADVDLDGDTDLVLYFAPRSLVIQPTDTRACLVGSLLSGESILGCDSVRIVRW